MNLALAEELSNSNTGVGFFKALLQSLLNGFLHIAATRQDATGFIIHHLGVNVPIAPEDHQAWDFSGAVDTFADRFLLLEPLNGFF